MKFDLNIEKYNFKDLLEIFEINTDYKPNNLPKQMVVEKYNNLLDSLNETDLPISERSSILNFLELAYGKVNHFIKVSDNITMDKQFMNQRNDTFTTSGHQVIKKSQSNMNINQISNKSVLKLLNINTKFRKNYYEEPSTNFSFDLTNDFNNVVSMKLVSIQIPKNAFYPISSKLGTNEFTIIRNDANNINGTPITIKILDGNYTGTELQDYLNKYVFNNEDLSGVACDFDSYTKKFRFFQDYRATNQGGMGASNTFEFDIDWRLQGNKDRPIQLNLGWLLGYKKQYYKFTDDYASKSETTYNRFEGYTPESIYNLENNYYLLSIDDHNNNHPPVIHSPFQESVFNDNNLIAIIPTNNGTVDFEDIKHNTKRIYMGPVNLKKIKVTLYDQYGRIVDLNHSDYSFALELEQLYDISKNFEHTKGE